MGASRINHLTVVGNCQAPVLAKLIKGCSLPEYEINSFILHRDSQDKLDTLVQHQKSIILAVPFNSVKGNPSLSWQKLSQRYPESRIHMISNIYFEGYHPFWGYFYNSKAKKLYPDWDDYINYWIVSQYLRNSTKDLSFYSSVDVLLDRNIYEAVWFRSQAELAKRESESASITNISSMLDISVVEHEKLFWTCNHPTRQIFNSMVIQILEFLSFDQTHATKSFSSYEFLSNTRLPSYSELSSTFNSSSSLPNYIFKGVSYSWEELVRKHVDFLSKQSFEDIEYSLNHYLAIRPELQLLR